MDETAVRQQLAALGKSLFDRGYSCGGGGNISVKLADNTVIGTPTGSCLGRLDAAKLSKVDMDNTLIAGGKPSKEIAFHLAAYRANIEIGAVVHLHSTWLTALSCRKGLNMENAIRPFTPYYVMRVKELPAVPYFKPGAKELPEVIGEMAAKKHRAVLMQSHGVTVFGRDLEDAVNNAEELEETARLLFILGEENINWFDDAKITELKKMGA